MRALVVVFASSIVMAAGLMGFAPAAAESAEPFREADCFPIFDGMTYCYQMNGVVKQTETPSGNSQYHAAGKMCAQIYDAAGHAFQESCQHDNYVLHATDDDPLRLSHENVKSRYRFEFEGVTYVCTLNRNITYVDGEYRHDVNEFECVPPS